jgi:pilus assembly protein CpaE
MILATFSSDPAFSAEVRAAVVGPLRFETVWNLGYEDAARLRGVGSDQKCIAVVDYAERARAMAVVRAGNGRAQIATIVVGGGGSREELLELMQAGVRDVLPYFTSREIELAAGRAASSLRAAEEVLADLYAFVPAKPGCGATTVATNAMAMAARNAGQPILLLDFDVRVGMSTFLLKAEAAHSVVDALLRAGELDEELWNSLVSQTGNLHLLGSGPVDYSQRIESARFAELVDFAVSRYPVVGVDLPGSMDDYECEVMSRAKRIFLVCTPDIGALHVARRKSVWLHDHRLADKVAVVVNRTERRASLSIADIERIVEMPVRYMLPASANEIARAVSKGTTIEGSSPLAKQIARIASDIAPLRSVPASPGPMRRFVEYFSIRALREGQLEEVAGGGK